MKIMTNTITGLVFLGIFFFGCQEENMNKAPNERVMNSKLMEIYSNTSIQNAIISEHTLFPYHFVKNGADLNELGQRDLAVLTRHFIKNGGHLNIRRLGVSDELYAARVNVVYDVLKEAGIDMARISTPEAMLGGEGLPSEPSAASYETQVSGIRSALLDTGIDTARISASDGMPGGEGIPSERVLIILERGTEGTGKNTSTSYSPEMR